MDAIREFWATTRRFPPDFDGYRFLGKAVNEVGKAKFGPTWTGLEASPPRLLMPKPDPVLGGTPFDELAKPHERLAIDLLLQKHRPDFGRPYPERGPFGPVVAPFTFEQWDEGIRLAKENDEKSWAIRRRFAVVVDILIECLREGRMKSALRPEVGGDYSAFLPRSSWNSDGIDCRFSLCRMHPIRHFSGSVAGDGYQLIFVDIEGLEKLLASISPVVGSGMPIWQQIRDMKIKDTSLVRGDIAKRFPALSKGEFDMHWKRAAEALPDLKKAGRPPRKSTQ
ncbi:hypothetical protein [Rhizobium leguminosarum]|uniref:hypothetical protein n=1 Tax=Rhizobium leguminosarum TaxID=384 RepID=UPI0014424D3D|nr:hypothetical protein [Rhizobium leguminosarum]NKK41672.1 hypothetical protein [Rhizobium leguminosarum bv. viciae]